MRGRRLALKAIALMLWTGWVVSVLGGALPRVGSRLNGVEKEMVKPGPERDWTGPDWRQASITLSIKLAAHFQSAQRKRKLQGQKRRLRTEYATLGGRLS
ncbi:unnamed protein product [Prunus armeniaca]|uniref:Uncharacterized protein n=1 Tax=Prunus armeniaca TaxID=36596 RepID=A0A6J5Y3J3_PRUAR|nr:unnamed protein product [Prunus armeniaca]